MASTTKDLGRVMPVAQGAYSVNKAYTPLDIVSYNGGSYICLAANTGKAPTDMTCWQSLAMPGKDVSNEPVKSIKLQSPSGAVFLLSTDDDGNLSTVKEGDIVGD